MTEEKKQKNNSEVKRSSKNPQIKDSSEEKKSNKVTEMPSKEMASDLVLLSRQMQATQTNYPNKEVATKSIVDSINNCFDLLGKQDKVVRKQGLTNLKSVRVQIESMNDSMLKDREQYLKTIDQAIKQLEDSTGNVAVLTKEIKDKFLDQLPTFKSLRNSFLEGASPLIPFFLTALKEVKNFGKSIKEKAKAENDKKQEGAKKLLDSLKPISIADDKTVQKDSKTENKESSTEVIDELKVQSSLLEKIAKIEKADDKTVQKDSKIENKDNRLQKKLTQKQLHLMTDANKIALEVAHDQLDRISNVEENTSRLLEIAQKQYAEMEQNALQNLKEENKHQLLSPNLLPKEQEKEGSGGGGILDTLMTLLGLKKLKGMAKLLTKGLGGLLGIFGLGKGASKLLDGLEVADDAMKVGKFDKLLKIGKIGGKLLGKISLIGTIIFAVIDFVDGFANAASILEKDEKDVDIRDRIASGFASIVGGLVGIIDDIFSLFGVDTKKWFGGKSLGEWTTELLAKYWSALLHPIETAGKVMDWVKEKWDSFKFADVGTWLVDKVVELFDFLKNIFLDYIKSQVNSITKILPDWIVPDGLEEWAKPKNKDGEITAPDKTQEKQMTISEGISHTIDKAVEMTKSIFNGGNSNVVNAPQQTNVTNVHTAPIYTRNDDASFGVRLG